MNRWLANLLVVTILIGPTPAVALYVTGSEFVTGTLSTSQYTRNGITYGPFFLSFSYERSFDGTRIVQDLGIEFLFDPALDFDAGDQAAYRAAAEANIEGIWNERFVVVDTANQTVFPLVVDVTTVGPRFDQVIRVHPGFTDALNWFVADTPSVNAHEFGHLLGLFDEYIGGAVDRYPNPTLSDTGLMGLGALSATPDMFPRYYDPSLDFVSFLNPERTFELRAMPEPSANVVLSLSAVAVLLVTRRWRRRPLVRPQAKSARPRDRF